MEKRDWESLTKLLSPKQRVASQQDGDKVGGGTTTILYAFWVAAPTDIIQFMMEVINQFILIINSTVHNDGGYNGEV